MTKGSSTWEALVSVRCCKEEMPGYDFRIELISVYDYQWQVYYNKNGYILCLDMQHRQHNRQNWRYFAPDTENSD